MRTRMNIYIPPDLHRDLVALAARKKVSRSSIIEVALSSYLSPDGADRMEAAFTRRLDRLSRQNERLERDIGITAESLALFIRFWLNTTPPIPKDAQAAALAQGKERYDGFVDALGKRLQKGQRFWEEVG